MLKGKRVILRPVFKSDAENFTKWFNDSEVTQYLIMYLPATDIAEEKWIEDLSTKRRDSDVVFVIEVCSGRKKIPIGTAGLHKIDWKNRNAEFGIAIGNKKYWSNGYGTEAAELLLEYGFNQLNLHRIYSGAVSFNARSIRMHEKLGFKKEGCQREAIFRNGKYHDVILFGLLGNKWRENKKKKKN